MNKFLKLTAIPGLSQGDTWTPDGQGGYPQIIHVTDSLDGTPSNKYVVYLDEDAMDYDRAVDAPPVFDYVDTALAWLNRQVDDQFFLVRPLKWQYTAEGAEVTTEDGVRRYAVYGIWADWTVAWVDAAHMDEGAVLETGLPSLDKAFEVGEQAEALRLADWDLGQAEYGMFQLTEELDDAVAKFKEAATPGNHNTLQAAIEDYQEGWKQVAWRKSGLG